MKNLRIYPFLFSAFLFIVSPCLHSCGKGPQHEEDSAAKTQVRIGWQIPLATQGQIVQVLKRTDLLKNHGLEAKFVPFSYGGPQSEAALAGQLDVIFVGDQPAVNLIASGGRWKIVSRLFYTKTAIMVPLDSPIQKVEDLRGKTIASPFGSVAHRETILKEQGANLNADKDLTNLNLDILEISSIVQAGGKQTWGKVDAVTVWEPSTSLFEMNKLARIVDYTNTLGVVAISDDFMQKHPQETVEFLAAVLKSWSFYAANRTEVDKWYIEDARLSYKLDILASAAQVEPNIHAKKITDINLTLSEENFKALKACTEWSFERKYSKSKVDMQKAVDQSFLKKATAIVHSSSFDPTKIKVLSDK